LLEVGVNEGHCEKSASSRFFFRTPRPSTIVPLAAAFVF
jgi:hypothetical protein